MISVKFLFTFCAAALLVSVAHGQACGDRRGRARFPNNDGSCYYDAPCLDAVMAEAEYQLASGDYHNYGNTRLLAGQQEQRQLWTCRNGGAEYLCAFGFGRRRELRGLGKQCWKAVHRGEQEDFNKQMDGIVGASYKKAVPVSYDLEEYVCGCV